jgi:hypothetical protein
VNRKSLGIFYFAGFVILSMSISSPLDAAVSVSSGAGAGQCSQVVREIKRNWIEVQQAMLPMRAKLKRPTEDSFYCISPRYVRGAMERHVGQSLDLKCFTSMEDNGLGMCCDTQLTACARLRPDAAPVEPRQIAKKVDPNAKPSSASWMRVPSEEDQWKTPEKN